ncbi:MAG TPA: response regulator, partial [Pyrinomonadaceae bacterium]|nr:response regulator [Pyrinomonadaceae bacterium]
NIWVYSEVGRGTTVKIYLPRVDEAAIQRKEIAKEKRNLHGSETILLVEDEEAVMKLTHSVLELYGYRVLAATNGDDALVVSSGYDDPIHLLLTDVIMPGMNGRELADQLFWVRPETRVLYMSGYTDSAIENQGVLESGASFIQKPFGTETMARKVREVLSSPK